MKLKRSEALHMFENDYCYACNQVSTFEKINTGLPGIIAKRCKSCDVGLQANYLEDGNDMIEMLDDFDNENYQVWLKENQ